MLRPKKRVLAFATVAALLVSSNASASNFGSAGSVGTTGTTNGVFLLPNSTMTVKRVNLTSQNSGSVYTRVSLVYNNTDLIATTGPNSESCSPTERVCVFDANYGNNGLYGWNACRSGASGSHPNMRCSHQWVRLNTAYTPPSAQRLACHELGHTVGIRHTSSTDTCMTTDLNASTSLQLNAHDRAHINANY